MLQFVTMSIEIYFNGHKYRYQDSEGNILKKIAIVTDSNSGMSRELADKYDIKLLPMMFTVDGKEYEEGISITGEFFCESMRAGKEVSTSQPAVSLLMDTWDSLLNEYEKIIHIPMSKALSGGYATAVMLSEDYDGKVLVLNSTRISVTQETVAINARKLADQGLSAEEITAELEKIDLEASIYITVESLEYLKKGGRVNATTATIGDILNIKPVLQVNGGLIDTYGKVRGHKKAKKMIEDALKEDWKRLAEKHGEENVKIYVGHIGAEEEMHEWKKKMEEIFPGHEVLEALLPMSIGCHVGPGTVGAAVCI